MVMSSIEWFKNVLGFLGCKENYYKELLQIEKDRTKVYKKGYDGTKRSYNEVLNISKELIKMIGDENCPINRNELYRSIEMATKHMQVEGGLDEDGTATKD